MKSLQQLKRARMEGLTAARTARPSLPEPVLPDVRPLVSTPRPRRSRATRDVALQRDVCALADSTARNAKRDFDLHVRHARAIDQLSRAVRDLQTRLEAVERRLDESVFDSLRELRELRARLEHEASAASARQVNEAVSSMQVAAYGERGNVVAANNLLLAGNQLLWGNVDALLRRLGLWSGTGPHPLIWLGPLLSLPVLRQTLGQQQYERYVSGDVVFQAVPPPGPVPIPIVGPPPGVSGSSATLQSLSLESHVAPGIWDDLRRRANVPATAQVLGEAQNDDGELLSASASVSGGRLSIRLSAPPDVAVRVVWTVDTGARET